MGGNRWGRSGNRPGGVQFEHSLPTGSVMTRKTSTRPQTIEEGVGVPFLQSVGIGVFTAVVGGLLRVNLLTFVPWWLVGFVAVSVGAIFFFGAVSTSREILYIVEEIVNLDINNDGDVGRPALGDLRKSVEIAVMSQDQNPVLQKRVINVDPDKLMVFFTAVLDGETTSMDYWTVETDQWKRLGRNEYVEIRDHLLDQGWAEWRNPGARGQGWALTEKGVLFVQKYVETAPTAGTRFIQGGKSG